MDPKENKHIQVHYYFLFDYILISVAQRLSVDSAG